MVSFIISRINSAMADLKEMDMGYKVRGLTCCLRNLRTFLLCTSKLGSYVHLGSKDNKSKHGSLGSLLARIEYVVRRIAEKLMLDHHNWIVADLFGDTPDKTSDDVWIPFRQTLSDIEHYVTSFDEEIEAWYIILSDYSQLSSSRAAGEIMEIIDSILEDPEEHITMQLFEEDGLPYLIADAWPEKLAFVKNLIRFSTLQGIEQCQLEDLLTRSEAFATNMAHFFHMCQENIFDMARWKEMELKLSVSLEKIKPETYIQALRSSKFSRQLHSPTLDRGDDQIIIVKDFIGSLISILWEMLHLDTCSVVSMKDQLQALYVGLRFLRTSLKEQPSKFDEKTRDLTRVVICDAAAIIFSLSQTGGAEIDFGLQDLLQVIKIIGAEVEDKVPEASTLSFPRTNELGFVDFLLEKLMGLTSYDGSNDQSLLKTIQEELVFLRSFLREISELHSQQEELQALWSRVIELAYKVEILVDSLVVGDTPPYFSLSFDSVLDDMRDIRSDTSKTFYGKKQEIKEPRTSNYMQSQRNAPIINEVVGLNFETTSIVDRLTRGSEKLRIVAIVGMPGIGKTTLATKVYSDTLVVHHFHVRAWCSVSQVFQKKKILLELLNHIVPGSYFEMTEQDLAETLRHHLLKRRFLIFFDDVWEPEVWISLEGCLPDDSNGSRIIFTSRNLDAAPQSMLDQEPHLLHPLTEEESWQLLQKNLFPGNVFPPTIYELGKQIAQQCKGLPLTINIIAGILANIGHERWGEVLESLCSGIIYSAEQCKNSIELSYKHLPDHLKPCFLYFGLFPEDQEISVKRLIWLWSAEGFVRKSESQSSEDVATDYVMKLIGRNLIMVAQPRSIGGVKSCRIHDMVHDFCLTKAKEENFFKLLKGYDELLAFNAPCYLWRLCIQSKLTHFMESKLFCPHVRSLLILCHGGSNSLSVGGSIDRRFHISFVIPIFKLLRVLDIGQIYLGHVFPSELVLLVQLTYLAVRGKMEVIPSIIDKLSNLETFVLNSEKEMVSLPDSLWNLQKLRHLYIRRAYRFAGFSLPIENLDNCFDLLQLDSFSGAIIAWHRMENQLQKFPCIRKLKCKLLEHGDDAENCDKVVVPGSLSRLESLELSSFIEAQNQIDFELSFPANLKKLVLSGFWLPWSKISTIGRLPNLQVLKLLKGSFSGETWEMEEGEFPNLRFLKLASVDIGRWTASDDHFLRLQKLVFEECHRLKEIPSCLDYISTLETIEVSSCPYSLASLVQRIQEEQRSMGNLDLKIFLPPAFCESSSRFGIERS